MLCAVPNVDEHIVLTPPLLCVEILSSDDRIAEIRERVADYAGIGVPASWVVDPWRRTALQAGSDGILHETDGDLTIPGMPVRLAVKDVFGELDRRERRAAKN